MALLQKKNFFFVKKLFGFSEWFRLHSRDDSDDLISTQFIVEKSVGLLTDSHLQTV